MSARANIQRTNRRESQNKLKLVRTERRSVAAASGTTKAPPARGRRLPGRSDPGATRPGPRARPETGKGSGDTEVFDNLSKTLAEQASRLTPEEQLQEGKIRSGLVGALQNFDQDRTALARNLIEYRRVFKDQRQWTRVAAEIGGAVHVSARTIFRLIEDYENSRTDKDTDMIDLSNIKGAPLNKEDRGVIRARLTIRALLDEFPNNKKKKALAEVLAEEAYQIWGERKAFVIDVLPRPSRFTFDGRKRVADDDNGKETQWKTA